MEEDSSSIYSSVSESPDQRKTTNDNLLQFVKLIEVENDDKEKAVQK